MVAEFRLTETVFVSFIVSILPDRKTPEHLTKHSDGVGMMVLLLSTCSLGLSHAFKVSL